jgi:hypothetical protein
VSQSEDNRRRLPNMGHAGFLQQQHEATPEGFTPSVWKAWVRVCALLYVPYGLLSHRCCRLWRAEKRGTCMCQKARGVKGAGSPAGPGRRGPKYSNVVLPRRPMSPPRR